jgi:hypothetical protein
MALNVRWRVILIGGFAAIAGASTARGDFDLPSFFVDDPTHNSQNWTSAVASERGLINSDVNFQTMTPASLVSNNDNYYDSPAHPDGVRLFASDSSINSIVSGPGPDQGGRGGTTSAGEGQFTGGNYLLSTSPMSSGSSLTIRFSTPVLAVGLDTIDYFGDSTLYNGRYTNTLTLSVYGVNGNLLGSATGVRDDFQPDNSYFMGYVASSDVIGSAVFSRSSDLDGDSLGIPAIEFATGGGLNTVPEPSALALLAAGAATLAARRRRRAA